MAGYHTPYYSIGVTSIFVTESLYIYSIHILVLPLATLALLLLHFLLLRKQEYQDHYSYYSWTVCMYICISAVIVVHIQPYYSIHQ